MKARKTVLVLISTLALATACKKAEKGDVGPAGPSGAAGATGATGAVGTTGATGATGSANVIYSAWQTSPTASRDTTVDGTCVRIRHLYAPSLTQGILDSGLVITYMRVGSIGPYQLPYTSDAGGATNQIGCIYNKNKIFIYRETFGSCRFTSASAGTAPVLVNLPQSLEYRYVIVPGTISGGRLIQGAKIIDIAAIKAMSYETLLQHFTIPAEGSNQY